MMAELPLQLALVLLLLAAAVAVAVKFIRLPYTIALVIVGTAIGASGIFPPLRLSKELLLGVLLPPILFEGALYMDLEGLRRNWRSIGALALLGTLISAALIGVGAHYLLRLDWPVALLLGVIVSPTDPASVLALFRRLRLERLTVIIEGESVFNDGLAVVLFGLVLAGAGTTPLGAIGEFFRAVSIGTGVGLGFGYLVFRLLAYIDDYLIEGLLTLILAYASFIIAEALGGSGVIAVVLAGLIVGNYGRTLSMSPTTRVNLTSFWEFGSFMANSLLFLLIGLGLAQVELALKPVFLYIFAAIGLVLLARAAAVYPLCGLLNILREEIPLRWQHLIFWGGLRGSIPIALVLGLHGVVSREIDNLLLTTVFGVVAFSLIAQGLTIGPLVRRLG
ncbi:MAG: cation:proton antiporter, partial [Candidatus Bipolaricaulia bacterium]